MSDLEPTDPEDLVGEWVNVTPGPGGEWTGTKMAVLEETDVDLGERFVELHEVDGLDHLSARWEVHEEVPYDVVRFRPRDVAVIPRCDWRERHPFPP